MKKTIIIFLLILSVFAGNIYAQTDLNENEVKSTLKTIFKLSQAQNYADVSSLFLFSENDKNRSYNYNSKAEVKSVKRMAKKIKAYLNLSDSYEYESISYSKLNNYPSAELKVNFASGNQELTISFNFVKINNAVLLAEFK